MFGKHSRLSHAALVAGLVGSVGVAHAEENPILWVNPDVGDWNDGANWDPDIPAAGDEVVLDGGTAQLSGGGEAGLLTIGLDDPGALEVLAGGSLQLDGELFRVGENAEGSVTVDGGTLTAVTDVSFNIGAGDQGTMSITGSNANVASGGNFSIGHLGGTGELTIEDGLVLTGISAEDSGHFYVGRDDGSEGTMNISGGQVGSFSDFRAGYEEGATGTITITGGEVATNSRFRIGHSGTGTMNVDGGEVDAGSRIQLGDDGGTGFYNQTGGEVTISDRFNIAEDDADGIGEATISGGLIHGIGRIRMGGEGTGTLNVEGGEVEMRDRLQMARGTGSATFNLSGGSVQVGDGSGQMRMAENENESEAHAHITGGELRVDGRIRIGMDGTATFTLEDGHVSNRDRIALGENAGSDGTFLQSGGILDLDGDMRLASRHSDATGSATFTGGEANIGSRVRLGTDGDGSFTVEGGEVTIGDRIEMAQSGGNATYTQSGGTVDISNDFRLATSSDGVATASISDGDLSIGGTLRIGTDGDGSFDISGGNIDVGSGTVEIGESGSGSLALSGDADLQLDRMTMAHDAGSSAELSVAGNAELDVAHQTVGIDGNADVVQDGGAVSIGFLEIGAGGQYTQNAGSLEVDKSVYAAGGVDLGGNATALDFEDGIVTMTGSIDNAGNASLNVGEQGLVVVNSGTDLSNDFGSFSNAGMTHEAGNTLNLGSNDVVSGTGRIDDPVNNQGQLRTSAGDLMILREGLSLSNGGTLRAGGTVESGADINVTEATVHTRSNDAISISGDYTQDADSTLLVELMSSSTQGISASNVNLDGELRVARNGQQSYDGSDEFVLVSASDSLVGDFAGLALEGFLDGQLVEENGTISITGLEPTIAGDATGDGEVGPGDLGILAGNWGQEATWGGGDFTGDGMVGPGDLGILAGNWGQSVNSGTGSAVPEPGSLALLAAGGVLMLGRRRRM